MSWLVAFFIAGFVAAVTTRGHRDFLYFLLIVPFFFAIERNELKAILFSRVTLLTLLLFAYLLISQAWSSESDLGLYYDRVRWALLAIFFVFVVAFAGFQDPAYLNKFALVLAPTVVLVCIYSFFVTYSEQPFPAARTVNAVFYSDNPIRGSVGIALASLVCGFRVIRGATGWRGALFFTASVVGIVFLILAQSRGLSLAVVVALASGLVTARFWRTLGVLGLLALAVVLLTEFVDMGVRGFLARADTYRFDIWLSTLERLLERPFFGQGLNSAREIYLESEGEIFYSPHNIFLSVGLVGGFLGLSIFLAVYFFVFYYAIVIGKTFGEWFPLSVLIFGVVHLSLAGHEVIYRVEPHVWLGLLLPLGLIVGRMLKVESIR